MLKIVKTKNTVTNGNSYARVVLAYDLGIIYNYHEPDHVLAVFENGKWHKTETPYYSSGGWGSGSTGDWYGNKLGNLTSELLRAIGGSYVEWNMPHFYSEKEFKRYQDMESKVRSIQDKAKKLGIKIETNVDFEPLKSTKPFGAERLKGKGINLLKVYEKMKNACDVFLKRTGREVKIDGYIIDKNKVVQGTTLVAFYDNSGNMFMNSQVLNLTTFEHRFLDGQSIVQQTLNKHAKYKIPFNVLESANLSLGETKIVEQGAEETFTINDKARHFTGAMLLENSGRKFLMDIDRVEIKHGIFNAFFVEVDSSVASIQDAYASMKPQAVIDAEKAGIKVKRQGEWFFIDAKKSIEVSNLDIHIWSPTDETELARPHLERFDIAHGKGRPNQLYKPVNFGEEYDNLVCGIVTHSGREHYPLNLGIQERLVNKDGSLPDAYRPYTRAFMPSKSYNQDSLNYRFKLWRVVPNTTISNFTITGDVD